MSLDRDKFWELSVYHYIDVLFVKYENGDEYHKDIEMENSCNFKWKIEGEVLQQMRDSFVMQMFNSKLFDSMNNNW